MLNRLLTPKEQWLLISFTAAMVLGALALWYNGLKSSQDSALAVLRPEEKAVEITPQTPVPIPESESILAPEAVKPEKVAVAVMGAVEKEGLYWLKPEARVLDLLEEAGGSREGADLQAINRAAHLIDGTTLSVPWEDYMATEGEQAQYVRWGAGVYLNPPEYLNTPWSEQVRSQYAKAAPEPGMVRAGVNGGGAVGSVGCIQLSTATLAELETLPGIGPELGQRILDYREQFGFQELGDLMNVSGIAEKRFAAIAPLVCL